MRAVVTTGNSSPALGVHPTSESDSSGDSALPTSTSGWRAAAVAVDADDVADGAADLPAADTADGLAGNGASDCASNFNTSPSFCSQACERRGRQQEQWGEVR